MFFIEDRQVGTPNFVNGRFWRDLSESIFGDQNCPKKINAISVINGVSASYMKKFLSNSVDLMKKLHMRATSKGLALTWKAEVEAEEPADGGKKG